MKNALPVHARRQSRAEELANSVSHALALLAMIAGTPFLIINAIDKGGLGFVVGSVVFAVSAMLLYLCSAVYHALKQGRAKDFFRIIDHSAIFLLIAGTYTPFTLGVLKGAWGWTLFGLVWGLAAVGVMLKALQRISHPFFSTGLYLLMGWLVVIAIKPLMSGMPTAGLLWLLAGGLMYTLGVVFFATDSKLKFGHFTWHLFVIGGTACHYIAIVGYAA